MKISHGSSFIAVLVCSVHGQHEIHQFWGGSKSQLTLWVVRLFPINNSRRKTTGSLAGSISTGQTYLYLCHHHRGDVILFFILLSLMRFLRPS